jgi:hypothetical protein
MNTSQLPDLPELGQMAKKLFGDLKKSVEEIFNDYKCKHPGEQKKTCSVKGSSERSAAKKTTIKKTTKEK